MGEQATAPSQPLVEFVRLEASVRSAGTIAELGFVIANQTHRLVSYRQAFFCSYNGSSLTLETISGLAGIDRNSPFHDWFSTLCKHLTAQNLIQTTTSLTPDHIPDKLRDEWEQWLPEFLLLVPIMNRENLPVALLLLARDDSFSEQEQQTLQALTAVYGHALSALQHSNPGYQHIFRPLTGRRIQLTLAALLIGALFIPVRQSSLGTAEVTPLAYNSIAAPLDGVIANILVKPNEHVQKGKILFRLDDTTVRNKLESAHRTMGVARTEAFLSYQKSFSDPQSRSEIATQEAKVREKGSTISYMREMMMKMEVRAPADGIVLFGDPADWEGKPVVTGERVMTLADEKSAGITIWLPAADAISLEQGRRVRLFLHTNPLHPQEGKIIRSSYQPLLSPEGIASYRITAEFSPNSTLPRLGLKGTAKVYGDTTSLGYYLFRRPIAALRQRLGW